MITREIEKTGNYHVVQGKEIVNTDQGLVSYLTGTYPENVPFKVAIYQQIIDDVTDQVISIDRRYHTLSQLYSSAADAVDCRIFGGVAFFHVNINHSCAANAIDRHGSPPIQSSVEIKFKLVEFPWYPQEH